MPARRSPALDAAPQATREGAVALAFAVVGAVVVALWWHDTPAGGLHSLGDELTAVGRLTGLLGTYLVLVEVILMARVPRLDRMIGMDRLATWHRRNGEYVVALLSTHAVAIIVGYALSDHVSIGNETGALVLHYPDMLAATVALGLLIGVGVISARAVRRRFAYQTWYFVHLYVYIAVVLAFAHELSSGNDFATHPLSRAVWIVLHVGTATVLIGYRVVAPIRSARRHDLRVSHVVRESDDVVSVYITGRELDTIGARPGQFFLWRFLDHHGWWQAHPFSLSAAPDSRHLRITVRELGDRTRGLARLAPGTRVIAEGPYGNVTEARRRRRKVLLVAGGIGIAPVRALFESVDARPGDLTLLYRANSENDLVLRAELEAIARKRGAKLFYATGPRDNDPLRAEWLRSGIPRVERHDVYVFGSEGFVNHAVARLRAAGVPRRALFAERFEM